MLSLKNESILLSLFTAVQILRADRVGHPSFLTQSPKYLSFSARTYTQRAPLLLSTNLNFTQSFPIFICHIQLFSLVHQHIYFNTVGSICQLIYYAELAHLEQYPWLLLSFFVENENMQLLYIIF